MRRRCAAVAVSALVLLGWPQPGWAGECAVPAGTPAASAGSEAQFARATTCMLNEDRARRGLSQLRRARGLDRAAEPYARNMVARQYFSHVNPEGEDLFERVRATPTTRAGGRSTSSARHWRGGPAHWPLPLRSSARSERNTPAGSISHADG
jgi:hypothetical protein